MRELDKLADRIRACEKCGLCKTRNNVVPGEGPSDAKLFFIGEAPGRNEDETGRPFIGQSGRLLTILLREAGIDRKNVFITSILKCRPPNNRKPRGDEIESCKPYLLQQINIIKPKAIVLLGLTAISNMMGEQKKLKDTHGQVVGAGDYNYFITYHPAAARRFPGLKKTIIDDFKKLKRLEMIK
jgi:DNA polymerase